MDKAIYRRYEASIRTSRYCGNDEKYSKNTILLISKYTCCNKYVSNNKMTERKSGRIMKTKSSTHPI